jgi:hypothetical protein
MASSRQRNSTRRGERGKSQDFFRDYKWLIRELE